jgi:hypothetical protein
MNGTHSDFHILFTVKGKFSCHIDITDTVAVGQKEAVVLLFQIFGSDLHTAAGPGSDTGSSQSDFPITFIPFVVELELFFAPRKNSGIAGPEPVIGKVIDETLSFVAEAEDETLHAECGIAFHDMPDDGLFADGDHGFGQQFGHFTQACSHAAAKDHQGRHLAHIIRNSPYNSPPFHGSRI